MALTLAQLLEPDTAEKIRGRLLAALNTAGFPVNDWQSGGAARSFVEAFSKALGDSIGALLPKIAGGGFLEHAEGDWLTFLARQKYKLDRTAATFTKQRVTLTAAPGAGPFTFTAGELIAQSATGNEYVNTTGGTLDAGGTLQLEFQAQGAGSAYADGPGQITTLVTAVPGVTASNTAGPFTSVTRIGRGAGTITPTATVPIPATHRFSILITSTGQRGGATFSYAVDGEPYSPAGVVPMTWLDLPGGTRITFADGAASDSFVKGDEYNFGTPASTVLEQGRDDESDESVRERARATWAGLAVVPTEETYIRWAKEASREVTKAVVSQSFYVPGRLDLTIAGAANPIGEAAVTAVQTFVDARATVGTLVAVLTAAPVPIVTTGTVTVARAATVAVQQASQQKWNAYLAELPIGGVVRAAELAQALMDAGAIDVADLALNAVSPNFVLEPRQVAVSFGELATALAWVVS